MSKILLTKEERKALVVLHSNASHGPWAYESDGDNGNFNIGIVLGNDDKLISGYVEDNTCTVVDVVSREVEGSPNAAFIVEAYNIFPRLLYSLEIFEARTEKAEAALESALQVNAARQAEGIANILNGMMAGITGEKGSVRLELGGFHCPYCNEVSKTVEEATAHDATCPKHSAVIRAEKAESERKKDIAHCKYEFERAEAAEAEVARLRDYKDAAEFEAIVSAKLAKVGDDFPCNHGEHMYCPNPQCKGMECAKPWCLLRIARIEAEAEINEEAARKAVAGEGKE